MNITRGKIKGKTAGLALLALFVCASAGAFALTQDADASAALSQRDAALFLPATYEQYLELDTPKDIAFSERYTVVADGYTLYIYDREQGSYSETALSSERSINKIGFAGERLFVADGGVSNYFYEYIFTTGELRQLGSINCSTFCIDGDTLYTATGRGGETTIGAYSISSLREDAPPARNLGTIHNTNVISSIIVMNGALYCAFGDRVYSPDEFGRFDDASVFYLSDNPSDATSVQSVCALGGHFYYTAAGGLYRTDLERNSTRLISGDGYTSVTSHNNALYVIQGSTIKEVTVSEQGASVSGYEISASSSSVNRLSGAVDTARGGELLVTADAGNHRVSVYNAKTNSYSFVLPENEPGFMPEYVATDGELIAVSAGNRVYTCRYGEEILTVKSHPARGLVRGLACVFGNVYYVTENAYVKIDADGNETDCFHDGYGAPVGLTSNAYGDLYVAYDSSNAVYRFPERNFADGTAAGERLDITLPAGYRSLRADCLGNLYYLIGNSLYRNNEERSLTEVNGKDFTYTMSENPPAAFALGFEDNQVSFLFGNFIVRTNPDALRFPTLATVDTEDAFAEINRTHAPDEVKLIDLGAEEIGIRVDLAYLTEESEYFTYAGRNRIGTDTQGVLLGETQQHRIVAIYENFENTVYLFRKDNRALADLEVEAQSNGMWLTNNVYLYNYPSILSDHYPCAGDLPGCNHEPVSSVPTHSTAPLARGTRVTVLDIAHAPERDYAYIECSGTARAVVRGYVPLSYLAEVNPLPGAEEQYLWGYLREDVDFTSADGTTITLAAGTQVRLYGEGDSYLARYTDEHGTVYSATVARELVDWGDNDALRIALIVILSVLALLIIGVYAYMLPRKPKTARKKR